MLRKIIFFLIFLNLVAGDQNITIDDTDSSVSFAGRWTIGTQGPVSYGGSHRDSASSDATATFKFTGTAIYYLSPLLSENGFSYSTNIVLDSNPPETVDVFNPIDAPYAVRWSKEGLSDGPHTLILSPTTPNSVAVVDGFIYTVSTSPATTDSTSTTSTDSTSTTSTDSTSTTSTKSTPVTSTESPSSTHTDSSSSAQNVSSSSAQKAKTIAGSVIGALVAVVAVVIASLLAHKFAYLLNTLLFSLFGIFLFKSRRLVFKVDEHLEKTEIALFLSEHENWEDLRENNSGTKPIVWKVFEIGGANRSFDVSIPCESTSGAQVLGYGTVDQGDGRISSPLSGKSPASYLVMDGIPAWTGGAVASVKGRTLAKYTNELEAFALGTYDETRESPLEPFLLVNATGEGGEHSYPTNLFLHIFRSYGYLSGQYRDDINKLDGDSLLPNGKGLAVSNIKPLTTWIIKPLGKGRLGIMAGDNDPEDIKRFKQYEHDFKLHQSGMRNQGSKV